MMSSGFFEIPGIAHIIMRIIANDGYWFSILRHRSLTFADTPPWHAKVSSKYTETTQDKQEFLGIFRFLNLWNWYRRVLLACRTIDCKRGDVASWARTAEPMITVVVVVCAYPVPLPKHDLPVTRDCQIARHSKFCQGNRVADSDKNGNQCL